MFILSASGWVSLLSLMELYLASTCYGWHIHAKVVRIHWCQKPSMTGMLLGIIAFNLGLSFFSIKESAGSFDYKKQAKKILFFIRIMTINHQLYLIGKTVVE